MALVKTDFHFPGQKSVYHGKVRDVYSVNDDLLVMVATDRISAFDVILPEGIPYKGQMLNQIAAKFLDATTDICPNWKLATPDPMVTVGVRCEGFPVEMIVRGYLCGSAWRAYKSGVREICGVKLPEGMRENQRFPEPIITPTTKAEIGEHDQDISKEEILAGNASAAYQRLTKDIMAAARARAAQERIDELAGKQIQEQMGANADVSYMRENKKAYDDARRREERRQHLRELMGNEGIVWRSDYADEWSELLKLQGTDKTLIERFNQRKERLSSHNENIAALEAGYRHSVNANR